MLPKTENAIEKMKQIEYYKHLIRTAFNIVDISRDGYIDRKEVSYIMRYLLKFPSEAQIRDYIIEKLEGDTPTNFIMFDKFEPYMLEIMQTDEYEPASAEDLLAAFRVLDPRGEGYIDKDVMKNLLTTKGIPLRKREYEQFENFALDTSQTKVYYEDYVARLVEENDRHKEYLLKDYENYTPNK